MKEEYDLSKMKSRRNPYVKINKTGINKIKLLNSSLRTIVTTGRKGSGVISTFRVPLKVLLKSENLYNLIFAPFKPIVNSANQIPYRPSLFTPGVQGLLI